MRIIGCDLHARQQSLAMLHVETGEIEERTLEHEGEALREFYAGLPGPVRVGIEATGSMQWFLELMDELGVECVVGHPAKIRACEPRKQKHDRRDALLLMKLLAEDRFSGDLDAIGGAARCASAVATSPSVGADPGAVAERPAVDRVEPCDTPRSRIMEPRRTADAGRAGAAAACRRAAQRVDAALSAAAARDRNAG